MKNHIKNYIKIMGLAAVPFGTAQATDYEIKVTQWYTCDPNDPKSEKDGVMHFAISVSKDGGEPCKHMVEWDVCSDMYQRVGDCLPLQSSQRLSIPCISSYMKTPPDEVPYCPEAWAKCGTDKRFVFIKCSGVSLYIVEDPNMRQGSSVYKLIIRSSDEFGNFYVSSDVPTIGLERMRRYCSDNEIVDFSRLHAIEPYRRKYSEIRLFAYCENQTNSVMGVLSPILKGLIAKYESQTEMVFIYKVYNDYKFKDAQLLRKVEGVKTLRDALWHLEYEAVEHSGLPRGLKESIQVELRKKKEGQEALKEIKWGRRMYEISTGK